MKPLCFVLMPFGRKLDGQGRQIDFDAVYREMIAPAIERRRARAASRRRGDDRRRHPQADVRAPDPVRLRHRRSHHGQPERLLRARRAARGRPRSTLLVFCDGTRLPFDVAPLRGIPYRIDGDGLPLEPGEHAARLADAAALGPRETTPTTARCSSWSTACRASRSTTARPTSSANAAQYSRAFKDASRAGARRGRGRGQARWPIAGAAQSARGRGRHPRRPVALVPRREGARRR